LDKTHNQNAEWRTILWISIPIYLIALAYLILLGQVTAAILWFASAVYQTLLEFLAARITKPLPSQDVERPQNKTILWAQIAVIAVLILLTGWDSRAIPLWGDMVAWFIKLGESVLPVKWFGGPGNAVANPIKYFVIPFILLLIMGAKPKELGLGEGHKVWQV